MMKLFKWLSGDDGVSHSLESMINPANGLPMIDGSDIDIAGNLYGTDSMSSFNSPFSSTFDSGCSFDMGSTFDSGFGCGIRSSFDD